MERTWGHEIGHLFFVVAGRPSRELVLRTAAVVGNYDYILNWGFGENGAIKVAVGATGIVEVASVERATTDAAPGKMPMEEYGHLVDRNMEAINHDHYLSFRLDLDVDGQNKVSWSIDWFPNGCLQAPFARASGP